MDRIIRPVTRQLLRPGSRYPFRIPTAHHQRLYTMGHSAPKVSRAAELAGSPLSNALLAVKRPVALH